MTKEITSSDDIIDMRDVTERLEELREQSKSPPNDVEVFEHDGVRTSEDDCWADSDGDPLPAGWYYWTCLPGCMPEGDPLGPYDTEELANQAVIEDYGSQLDDDECEELERLELLAEGLRGSGGDHQWEGDWYPATLIRDSYFKEYAQELAEDTGAINSAAEWPNNCIDWEKAAHQLQMDYSSVEFDGVTYWYR